MASYLREVKELRRQMAAIPQLSKKQKVTTEEIAHLPQTLGGETLIPFIPDPGRATLCVPHLTTSPPPPFLPNTFNPFLFASNCYFSI